MTIAAQFINKKMLRSMIPLGPTAIDDLEKAGKFPRRFAISSRCVVWDLNDVVKWMGDRKEAGLQAQRPAEKQDQS